MAARMMAKAWFVMLILQLLVWGLLLSVVTAAFYLAGLEIGAIFFWFAGSLVLCAAVLSGIWMGLFGQVDSTGLPDAAQFRVAAAITFFAPFGWTFGKQVLDGNIVGIPMLLVGCSLSWSAGRWIAGGTRWALLGFPVPSRPARPG